LTEAETLRRLAARLSAFVRGEASAALTKSALVALRRSCGVSSAARLLAFVLRTRSTRAEAERLRVETSFLAVVFALVRSLRLAAVEVVVLWAAV